MPLHWCRARLIDVRIEIRVTLERALLPPPGCLADRQDDRVPAETSGTPRRRALVRVLHHLGARVARIAEGPVKREDLRGIADAAAKLFVDLLQAGPILARHLDQVTRFLDAGLLGRFPTRPVAISNIELDGLETRRLHLTRVVDVEIVEKAAREVAAGSSEAGAVGIVVGSRDHE